MLAVAFIKYILHVLILLFLFVYKLLCVTLAVSTFSCFHFLVSPPYFLLYIESEITKA